MSTFREQVAEWLAAVPPEDRHRAKVFVHPSSVVPPGTITALGQEVTVETDQHCPTGQALLILGYCWCPTCIGKVLPAWSERWVINR